MIIFTDKIFGGLVNSDPQLTLKKPYTMPSLYDKDIEITNAKARPRIVDARRTGKRIERHY